MNISAQKRTAGFTLIEVLVALVVISLGLLGIAGIQALAIGRTHSAQTESLAAIEAESLAAAMHANPGYWQAALFPTSATTIVGSTISDATLNAAPESCSTQSCTPTQMAGNDLKRWGVTLQSLIPGAQGSLNCQTGTPASCRISVTWSQRNGAAINAGTESAATTSVTYTLVNEL